MTTPLETIQLLKSEQPKFHKGGTDAWASEVDVFRFLAQELSSNSATLETGAGYSTAVFSSIGCLHIAVTPEVEEGGAIKEWCEAHGISTARTTFIHEDSATALPKLDQTPLDLVYIDGAHHYPYPDMDWHFTKDRLRVGGMLLVDDIRIPSCRILHGVLQKEAGWRLERMLGDTSVFRKIKPSSPGYWWGEQGINKRYPDFSFLPLHRRVAMLPYAIAKRHGIIGWARKKFSI